jgi:hypothetical protein
VIGGDDIAKLLDVPAESRSVDYKERLNWSPKGQGRYELLRDLACLANGGGGFLVAGVRQVGPASFQAVGVADDDLLPDPTELGALFREYFAPTVPIVVRQINSEEKRFGVVRVESVAAPVIAQKNAGDTTKAIIRRGAIYMRTSAASCEEASPEDVERLLTRVLESRLSRFARILETTVDAGASPRVVVDRARPFTHEALPNELTLRAADLVPLGRIAPPLRIGELETLLERSSVRSAGGSAFPRYIGNIDRSYVSVLRDPSGLVLTYGAGENSDAPRMVVVARLSRDGTVRVRETLWEDVHTPPGQSRDRLGVNAVTGFFLASLLYGYRHFGALGAPGFRLRAGIVAPEKRVLFVDSDKRWPFDWAYRATAADDLMIERDLKITDVDAPEKRTDHAFAMVAELFEYFGYRMERSIFDQILSELTVETDGRKPEPLRN